MKKKIALPIILIVLLIFALSHKKIEHIISGKIFNTTYRIKAIVPFFKNKKELKYKIKKELNSLNLVFSSFKEESEINKFNYKQKENKPFFASSDLLIVMKTAKNIYNATNGFWDPTISPLINLWGFGTKKQKKIVPKKIDVKKALTNVGFNNIKIESNYIIKKKKDIVLNLSSIAKGYAVDKISYLLEREKIENFIIEIGGEVYAKGKKNKNKKWTLGINFPKKNASPTDVIKKVHLQNMAMATSGNYRNFFEKGGKYYSHIINPKTGYTVKNSVVSASVIAKSCTIADGIATAIMVLGREKGLLLIENLQDVEALIIEEDNSKKLNNYFSSNFPYQ